MNKTIQSYHLSERFEVAFNQIHDSLKSIVNIHDDRFKKLLDVGARKHHVIRKYYSSLEQYAKLRNALVHDKKELGFYIAEPHLDVVKDIEMISEIFSQPNYALSIATREVVYFQREDAIVTVLEAIKKFGYAQYPVYHDKECMGLLTTEDIVKWMAENVVHTIVDLTDIKIGDIFSRVIDHPIEIAPKSIDIFTIENMYEEKHKQQKDLEAVIITENGKRDEKPLGMVTAWDLIEIDYMYND
ncbi:putative transcriptional regulator [Salirhabdus euzebyi]|uniref:Putative transcriptional regulator n=1 Tax=Salirhabdus euzebyi TaxID=394506 RepID=A0A841PXI5_9BACI|nr:CBS domain-containing protein [Salirhabdus euzebyi]MBB6452754.1 putative transcriptional regulator [Salirhabdus euzebyi]